MLVLSRKPLESVMVGASDGGPSVCKVTVLEICGGRVRLGFDVDSHVPVHRLELWAKLRAQESVALAAIAGPLTAGTEALPTG